MIRLTLSPSLAISFELADDQAREVAASALEAVGRNNEAAALDLPATLQPGEVVWTLQTWVVRVSTRLAQAGGYWTAEVTIGPHGTFDQRRIRVSWSERLDVPAAAAMLWVSAAAVSSSVGCRDFLGWLLAVGLPPVSASATAKKHLAREESRALIREVLAEAGE